MKKAEKDSYILHPSVIERVKGARERNERVFLFNSRRGLAPIVVCKDCGDIVNCKACGAPASLHGGKNRALVCHHCGARREADFTCTTCGGWNLVPLGIGVEAVVEEIKKHAPDANVLWLSSDSTTTRTKAKKVVEEFYSSGGNILVGTELALPYIRKDIEHAVVVSVDALFSIPDFLIHERIMNILLAVRRSATHTVTYQTRLPEHPLFSFAMQGNLIDYVRAEIKERKETGAPPFSIVITLTISGEMKAISEEMKKIQGLFEGIEGLEVSAFPAFFPSKTGAKSLTCMLTLDRKLWPHHTIIGTIKALPQYVRVVIDAENIM
jgi:primosomal protein N' (replication factor Y)